MTKLFFTISFLLFLQNFVTAQSKKENFNKDESKDLSALIKKDSSTLLKETANNACLCVDSISLKNKLQEEIAKEIKDCIQKQVMNYQISLKVMKSLQSINFDKEDKNISVKIAIDDDADKRYYFAIERLMKDSCKSLNRAVASNNKETEFSNTNNAEARKLYNDAIKEDEKANYEDALKLYKKAVKLDPNFAFAWDNIGVNSRKLGKLDDAISAYNKSLALDPTGITPLQNLPVVYEYKKDYDEAIRGYQNFIDAYPKNPEGYYGKARMYIYKNDFIKALDYMCKAYNLYIEIGSPYRVDAENIINQIFGTLKKQGKEDSFNKILKENNISQSKD
jgi:tetratricopeptide (TPR) repeat protein